MVLGYLSNREIGTSMRWGHDRSSRPAQARHPSLPRGLDLRPGAWTLAPWDSIPPTLKSDPVGIQGEGKRSATLHWHQEGRGRRPGPGRECLCSSSFPSSFLPFFFLYDVKSTNCVMVKSRGFGVRPIRLQAPTLPEVSCVTPDK